MAQYAALRALADHPDASASELARLCFVTRSRSGSAGRFADRPDSSGMPKPADGRARSR